jgi:hypothetical protein
VVLVVVVVAKVDQTLGVQVPQDKVTQVVQDLQVVLYTQAVAVVAQGVLAQLDKVPLMAEWVFNHP